MSVERINISLTSEELKILKSRAIESHRNISNQVGFLIEFYEKNRKKKEE